MWPSNSAATLLSRASPSPPAAKGRCTRSRAPARGHSPCAPAPQGSPAPAGTPLQCKPSPQPGSGHCRALEPDPATVTAWPHSPPGPTASPHHPPCPASAPRPHSQPTTGPAARTLPARQGTLFPFSYSKAVNRNTDYFRVRLLIASTCCTGWDAAFASPCP